MGGLLYELTPEGREYLENGLPEKRLIRKIHGILGNKKKVRDLVSMPGFSIAFSWARKNGWVEVEGEYVKLTEAGKRALGEKTEIEKALESVAASGDAPKEVLRVLISRGLVKRKAEVPDEIAQLTPEMIITGAWKKAKFKKYDVKAPAPVVYPGKRHPYSRFIDMIKRKFVAMGFEEAKSPIVELEFWNFDVLFQAQNHPAREVHDTFFVEGSGTIPDRSLAERVKKVHETGWITGSSGWGCRWDYRRAASLVLRSQTTAASARYLYENRERPELKMFCIDRVFRPDVVDRTHLIEFHQAEGIVMADGLNFRHLLGILKDFSERVVNCDKVRFVPSYYPFTEPSVDLYVRHPELGWIEVGGAGLFRPEVLAPLKVKKPVIAWGLGLTRLAMIYLGVSDVRDLFSRDIDWLRRKEVCLL